jgi:hypothetical protein
LTSHSIHMDSVDQVLIGIIVIIVIYIAYCTFWKKSNFEPAIVVNQDTMSYQLLPRPNILPTIRPGLWCPTHQVGSGPDGRTSECGSSNCNVPSNCGTYFPPVPY